MDSLDPEIRTRVQGRTPVAQLIRSFDWQQTPLGAIASWPEPLLFLINVSLAARHPILLMLGPELVQVYNDAFVPILTDRHPDALGQPGRRLWQDVWPVVGEQLEAVIREGKSFVQERAPVPILRHGRLEEAFFDYNYSPAFNADGTIAGIVVLCQDATVTVHLEREHELIQRTLQAERSRLFRAVHQAPVIFAVLEGPQHRIMMGNEHYLRLVSHRDVIGKTVAEALPEATEQGYGEILDRVYSTGDPFVAQGARFRISPSEGQPPEERILDFVYTPLRDDKGTITGIILIGSDITGRKKAESALIQNEKLAAVGRLASTIAHEINNPLEAVTNLLFLAQSAESLDAAQDYLSTADLELRRMGAIAKQTLGFNKQATEARLVTCTELTEGVLSIYESRIRNSNVTVELQNRPSKAVSCFDGEIRQVLNNLVSNAIDAMQPTGGRLLLRTRDSTDWRTERRGVSITVADTGTGVSKENWNRIFEAFFSTKGISGTGLGLWVTKEIIARHHGKISVRSSEKPPQRGTVFRFFLPYKPALPPAT